MARACSTVNARGLRGQKTNPIASAPASAAATPSAGEAGVDALVEVHDRSELDRALAAGSRIVGVNNRDLKTLAVSLQPALSLAPAIPDDVVAVAESGIRTSADLRRLHDAGFDAFLVGERLMAAPDPGEALLRLIAGAEGPRDADGGAR